MVDIPFLSVAHRVEQRYEFEQGVVEVGRYLWFQPLEEDIRTLNGAVSFNMALGSRPAHTRVDRIEGAEEAAATDAGRLLVMMPGANYHLSAPSGSLRSLHCAISCAKFASVIGEEIDWAQLTELGGELKPGTEIERILTRMHDELVHDRVGRASAIEALACLLCVELARHFRQRRLTGRLRTGGLSAWRVRAVMGRIHAQMPAPRLAELAELCGLTERQLSRAFKTETGVTVGQFVNEVTMERAHRLLTTTRRPIADIALELGFASSDSLAQAYRRATGAGPSMARRR